MTLPGTTTENYVRDVILKGALRLVGAYSSGDAPRAEQVADALEALELMIKEWQVEGFLWLKQFVYIDLVAGQKSYQIGETSTDLVHSDLAGTTDYLQRPTRIYTPTRRNSDGYEVPLTLITRSDYSMLSSKGNTGTVVQVYYDPQMTNGVLYVWPTPFAGVTDKIVCTVDQSILSVPPEWLNAVKWNLAARICPEYGVSLAERDRLGKEAAFMKENADSHQRENASTFFQPGR
jgi:hypothetical protein